LRSSSCRRRRAFARKTLKLSTKVANAITTIQIRRSVESLSVLPLTKSISPCGGADVMPPLVYTSRRP